MRFYCAVVVLLLPLAAAAQEGIFTPQHIAKLRVVTEAVISPDGKQVAYVLSVQRDLRKENNGGDWTELHVVDMDAKTTPLITGAVNVANIAWTPDGKAIAFLARRETDSTRCLYAISPQGGKLRRLVAHPNDIKGYSFSGDGNSVAFLATEPRSKPGKTQLEQGFIQEVYEEDQQFVRVYICSSGDRGESTRMVKLGGSASELHFHPREEKIAVALAPTPSSDDAIMFRKVHVVDLVSGRATFLGNRGKLGQVAWSPDGKLVAMIAGIHQHDPKEGRLFLMDARGNGEKLGISKIQRPAHFESFGWKRPTEFWTQAIHGVSSFLGSHIFVDDETLIHRYWKPKAGVILTKLSVSNNGQSVALIANHPRHPPEVYCADLQQLEPRRLTDSNPWLKGMRFAKQEVITYMAGDGLDLEGILIRPLNEEKGRRYPLVVIVHDGPAARYPNGWVTSFDALGQVAAAKGLAVFYPNYRGSTGYGPEMSMIGQKDAGGNEFYDLIDGVSHLVETGLVDKKKVGITGTGYGGYAAAWGATYYSDHFAAAVMFGGISDWVSCVGTTETPQAEFLTHHRLQLWDDSEYFIRISPIKHVKNAKTPLLILHGKGDTRVNPSQSVEMYRHLKARGQAPVRLVLYPGEGNVLRRQASRLDYNMRLLQWMEHYLKGPGGAMPPLEIDYGIKKGS